MPSVIFNAAARRSARGAVSAKWSSSLERRSAHCCEIGTVQYENSILFDVEQEEEVCRGLKFEVLVQTLEARLQRK